MKLVTERRLKGGCVPQRKVIAELLQVQRGEMVKYARAVSGDDAGAEDLVQDVWVRCNQAAQAQHIAKPAHLMWRILRNLSIDRSRRSSFENRTFFQVQQEQEWANLPDDQRSIEDLLIARNELAIIERVLDRLDPRTRKAFEMHRFDGAKLHEIAAHLGISVSRTHSLVAAALREIREALRHD